ncbi:MAG: hypothetical protein ABRQ39_04220 [Candidatus Eremiobacterota bacterium]
MTGGRPLLKAYAQVSKGESYRLKGKEKLLRQQEAKPTDEEEKNRNGK